MVKPANGPKRCLACGGLVEFDSLRRQRGTYCADPECVRERERLKKAAQRARQRATAVETPGRAVKALREAPGRVVSPWGIEYESEAEMWADVLLSGGLSGDVPADELAARWDLLEKAAKSSRPSTREANSRAPR